MIIGLILTHFPVILTVFPLYFAALATRSDILMDTRSALNVFRWLQCFGSCRNSAASCTETLEAGDNPQAPAVVEEQTVEDSTEPVAEHAPAELMLEAPPAESLQTEAPIETVPVEPAPVVAEPTPEPYVAPPVTETGPVEKVTEADMVEVIPREKNVEIEPRKRYTNYRDRRTTHGFLFSFNAENLYFQDYASLVDQKLYEELFGQEDLTLLQVQVDYKLNFMLGSIIAGAGFGQGTLIDDRVGEERGLTISKKSLRAQWLLDSITKEPYFVPYLGASLWQFGISEENKRVPVHQPIMHKNPAAVACRGRTPRRSRTRGPVAAWPAPSGKRRLPRQG